MLMKETIMDLVLQMKKKIQREIGKRHYEQALKLISCCADILYLSNIYYVDNDLEHNISVIANSIELDHFSVPDNDVVVFFDGFGFNDRGLILIYLKALCKLKRVVYVTYEDQRNEIPDILEVLKINSCIANFIKRGSFQNRIMELNRIILRERPKYFFLYSTPNDVVGTVIMYKYDGLVTRYQINLTDHAFWLGAKCIDRCIEFRDYGAKVSNKYRGISKEKIVKLPFYPEMHHERPFQGFPFDVRENMKVFFSGGALYKTLGGNGKYYQIIEKILSRHTDTIFWYAGSGNDAELKKIIDKFPGRAFFTPERSDLFQVLKHSRFYLSTYPICGGLMYQYAASSGRVPVTLYFDECTDGFLINQDKIGVEYHTVDALYEEVDRLLDDDNYFREREQQMYNCVMTETEFDRKLELIIREEQPKDDIKYSELITDSFRSEYLKRICDSDINVAFANRDYMCSIFIHFPVRTLKGILIKMHKKYFPIL